MVKKYGIIEWVRGFIASDPFDYIGTIAGQRLYWDKIFSSKHCPGCILNFLRWSPSSVEILEAEQKRSFTQVSSKGIPTIDKMINQVMIIYHVIICMLLQNTPIGSHNPERVGPTRGGRVGYRPRLERWGSKAARDCLRRPIAKESILVLG